MNDHTTGLSELLVKLKNDGLQKGEELAQQKISQAEEKAQAILEQAQTRAEALIKDAEKQINEQRDRAKSELQMAARDFCLSFEHKLKTKVVKKSIAKDVSSALTSKLMAKCLDELVGSFDYSGNSKLAAHVTPEIKSQLNDDFFKNLQQRIQSKELTVTTDTNAEGFKLIDQGEHLVWDFSYDAISKEIANLMEDDLATLLFQP